MAVLSYLIPVSLLLGGAGLAAFVWAIRNRQFDDPVGDANRILLGTWDNAPKPENSSTGQTIVGSRVPTTSSLGMNEGRPAGRSAPLPSGGRNTSSPAPRLAERPPPSPAP
jgi:cbb3-type cytochrome oxidase maturation protein